VHLLLTTAVLMLMVSIGMSLRFRQLLERWRSLSLWSWAWLVLATFLLPPALALGLVRILSLGIGATAGLFMVAATPGAPLLTRKIAKKGFDMQLAASYQVGGALLTPLILPVVVWVAGHLYGREIWIPPSALLIQIAEKQFLPLLCGLALANLAPRTSARLLPVLNVVGNLILTGVLLLLLVKMGPALLKLDAWLLVAALGLAAGCMLLVAWVPGAEARVRGTLGISNTNRHVGLALLLSGQYLHRQDAVPAIAAYALAAVVVIAAYTQWSRHWAHPDDTARTGQPSASNSSG